MLAYSYEALGEKACHPTASGGGDRIQPLDLTDAVGEMTQTYAAEMGPVLRSKKKRFRRWSVFDRKMLKFVREVLKRQFQVQRHRVFFDKVPRVAPFFFRLRLHEAERHLISPETSNY